MKGEVSSNFTRVTGKANREIFGVLVGRVVEAVGSLVFLKLLATLAGKDEMGQYLLAASFLAMALTMSMSSLDQGFLRNVTEYQDAKALGRRYTAMLVSYTCLSVVVGGFGAIVLAIWGRANPLRVVFGPLALWLASEAFKNLNSTVANGLRSRALIAAASAVDYASRVALLWGVYLQGSLTASAILLSLAGAGVAASVVFLVGHRSLLSWFSWSDAYGTLLDSMRFSWPMSVWALFGWLQNMSNRWLLSHFGGLPMVAEYGVLVAIGTYPVAAIFGVAATYLVPILYERESRARDTSIDIARRAVRVLLVASVVLVAAAGFGHRELMLVLAGRGYTANSRLLPLITVGACASGLGSVLAYTVLARRRVASLLFANSLPGVFSVVVGYVAVKAFSLNGAVGTLLLSNLLAGGLFWAAFARKGARSSDR
jgi:O-antigen/teichoic acid export membrane protein